MIRISLYVFLLMISNSKIHAQTDSAPIEPTEPNGTVRLNISAFLNRDLEKFAYDYLSVFVKNKGEEYGSNAVQGKHTIEGEYLVFLPYFPFEKGMTYVTKAKNVDTDKGYSLQSFQIGKKQAVDKAKVISIYPSSNELPENLLRFYFYFNTPMQKGQALNYIHLVDAAGNSDDHAFMEFKQELWSPDGKRLTLLFDPGRIKRGVSTNMELGSALLEGQYYKLVISDDWEDVYGQKLELETTKEFTVTRAYRHYLEVKEWVIHKPQVNSQDALNIHFDRIMDHALIQSMIQLEDEENNLIHGHWEVLENEQQIQFIPEAKWQKGNYQIVFDPRLEDVAGNNLNSLLDEKVTPKQGHKETSNLKFKIK